MLGAFHEWFEGLCPMCSVEIHLSTFVISDFALFFLSLCEIRVCMFGSYNSLLCSHVGNVVEPISYGMCYVDVGRGFGKCSSFIC